MRCTFGYQKIANPVRIGIIGTGDEGQVLIGGCTPEYVDVVAICDIRPYNVHRAFHGDWATPAGISARPGLIKKYDFASEHAAREHITVYTDYKELLKDPKVEAIIIALPLHLHASVAVEALQAGKHVLTEKLMAHSVAECKVMGRVANKTGLYLAVGHQRHYSVLYDNAVNLLQWGVLGELHHIRAQWHRGNLPGGDSWQPPLPGGERAWVDGDWKNVDRVAQQLKGYQSQLKGAQDPDEAALLQKKVAQWEAWMKDAEVQAENYGYESFNLGDGRTRTGPGRARSLAALAADWRRPHGGARQPPARRGQHLLLGDARQEARRRRQEGPPANRACRRRAARLPARPRRPRTTSIARMSSPPPATTPRRSTRRSSSATTTGR